MFSFKSLVENFSLKESCITNSDSCMSVLLKI